MQTPAPAPAIATVGVVGGGTAGYFAALALKKRFPTLSVTLIESSTIPIIGVGEATTTLMPPFLHHELGIDVVELYREVRPTWKLGIKFDWGVPGEHFYYPFHASDPLDAFWHEGCLHNHNLNAALMEANRTPILREPSGEPRSLLPLLKFAYHLHNAPLVAFLAKKATERGIEHLDALVDVVAAPDGSRVDCLRTRDGREVRFDLYVDASGFRSRLMGDALGSPFISYASSLFCDTAVVADTPQRDGVIAPYTVAETMDHGWCWRIPVEGVDHRGYVYASAFVSAEAAAAEMRARNPGMGDTWTVRFRSGRHADFWKGNVVAIGNAYGFVEPLESTALHMVIVELAHCVQLLEGGTHDAAVAKTNARIGAHWDFLRWFLAIHYKFNRKLDTEFWRSCREHVDTSGMAAVIAHFQEHGPWRDAEEIGSLVDDPTFGENTLLTFLLGQKVDAPPVPSRYSAAAWAARMGDQRAIVARAYSQADALALLRNRPDLLEEYVRSPSSWCTHEIASMFGAERTPS